MSVHQTPFLPGGRNWGNGFNLWLETRAGVKNLVKKDLWRRLDAHQNKSNWSDGYGIMSKDHDTEV